MRPEESPFIYIFFLMSDLHTVPPPRGSRWEPLVASQPEQKAPRTKYKRQSVFHVYLEPHELPSKPKPAAE